MTIGKHKDSYEGYIQRTTRIASKYNRKIPLRGWNGGNFIAASGILKIYRTTKPENHRQQNLCSHLFAKSPIDAGRRPNLETRHWSQTNAHKSNSQEPQSRSRNIPNLVLGLKLLVTLERSRQQPPRSPSRGQQDPHGPRRTHPPPYPHQRTSERRHAWRT